MRKLYLLILITLFWHVGQGQELPKVIPPSPSSQQFQKYVDYPVGNFTGIPDITIPIYTIQSGDLSIPISLSYHADGAKPSTPNGVVGMGWTLMYGGKITRTVAGLPDDQKDSPPNFYTTDQIDNMTKADRDNYFIQAEKEYYDLEPDMFSYNFNGYSGRFILKRDQNKTPLLIPYKPLKIAPSSNYGFGMLNVTDEAGVKYEFSVSESRDQITTAWDLSKITSATDPSNSIIYSGIPGSGDGPIEYERKRIDYFMIDDMASNQSIWRNCYPGNKEKPPGDVLTYYDANRYSSPLYQYRLSNFSVMTFREGSVHMVHDQASKMLTKFEIRNSSNEVLKTVELVYVLKPTNRQLLKEVDFYDNQHQLINSYKIDYYKEQFGSLPTSDDANVDYWGYYNGQSMPANGLMPPLTIGMQPSSRQSIVVGTNSRQTVEDAMTTFVVKRITYPTGGYADYEYEANKPSTAVMAPNFNGTDVGGLRIKKVSKVKEAGATPEIRQYVYSGSIMEHGYLNPSDFSYSYIGYIPDFSPYYNSSWDIYRRRVYSSEPTFDFSPHGSPVAYQNVEVYYGTDQAHLGKTLYTYDYVTTETVQYNHNTGDSADPYNNPIQLKTYLKPFNHWQDGNLTGKVEYKLLNGNYLPVYADYYGYVDKIVESVRGMKFDKIVSFTYDGCGQVPQGGQPWETYIGFGNTSPWKYGDYTIESGYRHLSGKSTAVYDVNGQNPVETETKYAYANAVHDQPTRIATYTSQGDSVISVLKYPHDFAGQSPYDDMVNNRHIWSPVIEENQYKGSETSGTYLKGTQSSYRDWGNNVIALQSQSTKLKDASAAWGPRITFQDYDNQGHVRSVSKNGGPKQVYIYGYGGNYPIAQVANADYNQVLGLLGGTTAVDNFRNNTQPSDAAVSSFLAPLRTPGNLPGAQVTTYTYKPVVGITSVTDPRGQVTHYQYDAYQRLYRITDHNNQILKQFCYNYAGQVTDCSAPVAVSSPSQGTIYARVEISNVNSLSNNGSPNVSVDNMDTQGDVSIKLYSDAACQVPYTSTQNLLLGVEFSYDYSDNNGSGQSVNYPTYTFSAGSNEVFLGHNLMLKSVSSYYDDSFGYFTSSNLYHYKVIPLNGSNYQAMSTNSDPY
jgi:YD repeat-containing protein